MKFLPMPISGVYLLELEPIQDERGSFARAFCMREFEKHGLNPRMCQSNISFNKKTATLRGMHYQAEPYAEDKLVYCVAGKIYDVAVDLRPDSSTYSQWFGLELSEQNQRALYIPRGFAHGFLTLTDNTMIQYQVSNFYEPKAEQGLRWNDPAIGIQWPMDPRVVSEKDRNHQLLCKKTGFENHCLI